MQELLEQAVRSGTPAETDVLIVGGSLVGLSAAGFLAHHGVKPLVIEKHAGTSIHPRAGYFHIGTLEAYRRIGLEPAILEASYEQFGPDGGINLVESLAGKELARFVPSINAGIEPYSPSKRFFMTQQCLEPLLLGRAKELGAQLSYRSELVAFEQHDDHVLATVRDLDTGAEAQVRAKYMVAADGWRSPVRQQLGIEMAGPGWLSDSITIYFKADCSSWLEANPMGVIYVLNQDQRGFFRFEAGGKRGFLVVNTFGDIAQPGATNVAGDTSEEQCIRLVRSAIGVPDIAVEIEDVAVWKATAECAESFRKGRVFIAGDAAHVVPPTGGFGGNTGVQDAANLCWKLAMVVKGEADESLLDSYEQERLPTAQLIVGQAYTRYVRRVTPELLGPDVPPLLDELTLEIGPFYRSNAVVHGREADQPACMHPDVLRGRAGARVPHAWLDDGRSTLDIAANGLTWLLGPEAPGKDGVRVSAAVAEQCGIGPAGALLVRPDGFVAEVR